MGMGMRFGNGLDECTGWLFCFVGGRIVCRLLDVEFGIMSIFSALIDRLFFFFFFFFGGGGGLRYSYE
jgi:hypothetical protein